MTDDTFSKKKATKLQQYLKTDDASEEFKAQIKADETTEDEIKKILEGMCVECGDQPAEVGCVQCEDKFCEVCFISLHKRGNRAKHQSKVLAIPTNMVLLSKTQSRLKTHKNVDDDEAILALKQQKAGDGSKDVKDSNNHNGSAKMDTQGDGKAQDGAAAGESKQKEKEKKDESEKMDLKDGKMDIKDIKQDEYDPRVLTTTDSELNGKWFLERSKYIPLRLSLKERKYLRLVEAAMNVSEYTDKIDIISSKDKAKRIFQQLKDVCAILSGLVVACDYKEGQKLISDKEFKHNDAFFQYVFELARRHKIRNPEKMRDAYGKLVYLLQDSVIPEIQDLLQFKMVKKISTVYSMLSEADALSVLEDELMVVATGEIMPEGKSRPEIDRAIKRKERAIETIAKKYQTDKLGYEDIRNCLLSIGDNHSYLRSNRDPCDKMLEYLRTYFKAESHETGWSLAIVGGRNGARLTHSHHMQYAYCEQSLSLWREIAHEMFKLWYLAEEDLLDEDNQYRLRNTGQGLNRIQSCPRIGKAMHAILSHCQRKVGSWVGSSVVHLGDHNVPNALMFIDKYNQVSRILGPVVLVLNQLEEMDRKPDIHSYIENAWGSVTKLRMIILTDFFRHAFDGSGADNFFDAGSCIDGRLTSAWNWCSLVEKKPYFPVFLLAGFTGFDGEF